MVFILNSDDENYDVSSPDIKYECLLSEISSMNGCQRNHPAELTRDKLSYHYMAHYIQRKTWDYLLPSPKSEEEKRKIEHYHCKLCNYKVRNKPEKNDFSARGSFLCHIGKNHGRLFVAMRDEPNFDLFQAIDSIARVDPLFNKFATQGYVPEYDESMYEIKHVFIPPNKVQENNNEENKSNVVITDNNKSKIKSTRDLSKCPLCDYVNTTGKQRSLRFHMYDHYKESWRAKVDEMFKGDLETNCKECNKRIPGASVEGWKNSMICHLAIQHKELKTVMMNDERIDNHFVEDLFSGDNDNNIPKNSHTSSNIKTIISNSPSDKSKIAKKPIAKKKTDYNSTSSEDEPCTYEELLLQEEKKRARKKSPPVMRTNKEYIRKRRPVNLTPEDLLEDSDDDFQVSESVQKRSKSSESIKRSHRNKSNFDPDYKDDDFLMDDDDDI